MVLTQLQLDGVGVDIVFAWKKEGRSTPHLASNRRNGLTHLKFSGCPVGVLRMSGGCLEGVWMVSGGCLEGVWMVSGGCLDGVWKVSDGISKWSVGLSRCI